MSMRARHGFPETFLWGTATSSHQVEGKNENNDWWDWEQQPGAVENGHRSGNACGWWDGRWKGDLDRAAETHQNAHRLSVEWSRVEPAPGQWDEDAISYYREILKGVRQRGLRPMVTLHHFTNPGWLAQQRGWNQASVIPSFARYVRKVVKALGDQVALWVTINEPNVYAYASHAAGVIPPGRQSLQAALQVMLHMVQAHAAAYEIIHQLQPAAQVGLAHHYRGMKPSSPMNPLDRLMTSLRDDTFNQAIPRALQTGVLSFPWKRVPVPEAQDTQDFFGLNYYTREKVVFDVGHYSELFGRGYYPEGADVSSTGFIANVPEGFFDALDWARQFDLPIYVTENGVEDPEDELRRRYIAQHIKELWRATNFNWQIKGYFHWTLVDNFEWDRGWTQRFGLWELDPESQERRKRPSADLYAEICRENALSTDMVKRYAPEVFGELFPEDPPGELTGRSTGV